MFKYQPISKRHSDSQWIYLYGRKLCFDNYNPLIVTYFYEEYSSYGHMFTGFRMSGR